MIFAVHRERFQRAMCAKSDLRDVSPESFLNTMCIAHKVTVTITQIVHKWIFHFLSGTTTKKKMIASMRTGKAARSDT